MFDGQIDEGYASVEHPYHEHGKPKPYSNTSNIPFSLDKESIELVLPKNEATLSGSSQQEHPPRNMIKPESSSFYDSEIVEVPPRLRMNTSEPFSHPNVIMH